MAKQPIRKRPHKFNFPHEKGNYWFLFWIGKIHANSNSFKVELYFVNKENRNDYLRDFNKSIIYKQLVPISYLMEYRIGLLYDVTKKDFVDYELANSSRLKLKNITNIEKRTNIKLPLLANPYFISPDGATIEDLNYFELSFSDTLRNNAKVFLTPYCIAQYLYFHTDTLVSKILTGAILDYFDLNSIRVKFDQETGQITGFVKYYQDKLTIYEANKIAPFLFLRGGKGLTAIKSIHASFFNKIFHLKQKNCILSSYLDLELPFSCFSIDLEGKFFMEQEYGIDKDLKKTPKLVPKYFLAYRISKMSLTNIRENIIVDSIKLKPLNSTDSTKDKDNHDKIPVTRVQVPVLGDIPVSPQNNSTTSLPALNDIIKNDSESIFNIRIDNDKRENQKNAYDVNTILASDKIESIVRELEEFDNEVKSIVENVKYEKLYTEHIDKFEYFDRVIDCLKNKFSLIVNVDPLNVGLDQLPLKIDQILVKPVYVFNEGYATCLVEFGKGVIGLFRDINGVPIAPDRLWRLLKEFVDMQAKVPKGSLLWTEVNRHADIYQQMFHIHILMGVEHTRIQINHNKDVFNQTAERIYKTRLIIS